MNDTQQAFFYVDGIPTKGKWIDLDAIIAHSGSLSQRIMGEAIEAEDVLSQSDWAGVNRFVLG